MERATKRAAALPGSVAAEEAGQTAGKTASAFELSPTAVNAAGASPAAKEVVPGKLPTPMLPRHGIILPGGQFEWRHGTGDLGKGPREY